MRPSLLTLVSYLIVLPANAQYSGGSGTAEDPYQIAAATDLITLGETPEDYDKHFILTANIDLDPKLPGCKVFERAVIAPHAGTGQWPFHGTPFTGVFDGNGHTISHLVIQGWGYLGLFGQVSSGEVRNLGLLDVNITSSNGCVGGLMGCNHYGRVTNCYSEGMVNGTNLVGGAHFTGGLVGYNLGRLSGCYSVGAVGGNEYVGGLVGINKATVTQCYSECAVAGSAVVGGLVGSNEGTIQDCYARGTITGKRWVGKTGDLEESAYIGGLVGTNYHHVICCCSTGAVSGDANVGGLAGSGSYEAVTDSFWDIQTSGQATSAGGTGKTTVEIRTAGTYLEVGWDFVDETENGKEDVWWILEGQDGPRLAWEFWASSPEPPSGGVGIVQPLILSWHGGTVAAGHDVYLGEDEDTVAQATPYDLGVYRGQQKAKMTMYDPGVLEYGLTYYWRIDEVNEAEPNGPWKGAVWEFTTADVASFPYPADGAAGVIRSVILSWVPGGSGLQYDVYFGEDEGAVAEATPESWGVYQGRLPTEMVLFEPGHLEWGMTYYWRIDGVDETDPGRHWKGKVWSFTTTDLMAWCIPSDGATDVSCAPILRWTPGGSGLQYDVYFGDDEATVTHATPQSVGVYRGRQDTETVTYEPGVLPCGQTYYWRIDEVRATNPNFLWKGAVWNFTTACFFVVDDFESYGDEEGNRIFDIWTDGWDIPENGSILGCLWPIGPCPEIAHGGRQSMQFNYENSGPACYSEAVRTWATPQDWTVHDMDTLTLYVRGWAGNGQDRLYVALEDTNAHVAFVIHPDPNIVLMEEWREWNIPLRDFVGVDPAAVTKTYIGIGGRDHPDLGGAGYVFIDDIRLTKHLP